VNIARRAVPRPRTAHPGAGAWPQIRVHQDRRERRPSARNVKARGTNHRSNVAGELSETTNHPDATCFTGCLSREASAAPNGWAVRSRASAAKLARSRDCSSGKELWRARFHDSEPLAIDSRRVAHGVRQAVGIRCEFSSTKLHPAASAPRGAISRSGGSIIAVVACEFASSTCRTAGGLAVSLVATSGASRRWPTSSGPSIATGSRRASSVSRQVERTSARAAHPQTRLFHDPGPPSKCRRDQR